MKPGDFGAWYRRFAVVLLNTGLLFAVVNLLIFAVDRASSHKAPAVQATYFRREALDEVYADLGPAGIHKLIDETQEQYVMYDPFTQFRERPHPGEYVNVDSNGFRHSKGQGPWPPDGTQFNVFVFGGSTTFNYGVRDEDTIASFLWTFLHEGGLPREPRVYNFGRGAYYSSQELILFERLLATGAVPDVAIFVDGLNDFFFHDDRPALTPLFEQFVADGEETTPGVASIFRRLPVVKLLARYWPAQQAGKMLGAPRPVAKQEDVTEQVIERFLTNKRLIEAMAASFGVVPLFVWQPVPTYRYEEPSDAQTNYAGHERSRIGYPRMAQYAREHALDHFIWCADTNQPGLGPLYLDRVHYTPRMSQVVASCIFAGAREQGIW